MSLIEFVWDLDDDPNGNVQRIAEHGLSKEDVEHIVCNPTKTGTSRASGRPMVFGYTEWGAYIVVVDEEAGANLVYPVTAFELQED